jgi:hypothetical protein
MRWRSAWLVASSAVVLGGCGSSSPPPKRAVPRIPATVARQLEADAQAVAAQTGCSHDAATKLLNDVVASLHRIPTRYQEPLTSAANDLLARTPACAPPIQQHERGKGKKKHKHRHGHGKHGDEGDD